MPDDAEVQPQPTSEDEAFVRGSWWMIVVLAITVATIRWWLTRHRIMFQFRSDEAGQLGMARIISGGTTWNMFSNVTWRPGFATLMAPLHWMVDDPVSHYRAAMLVNAVLGGVAAALLVVVAARLLPGVGAHWLCLFALAASLLPGVVLMTNWVWAESLATVVFLAALVAAFRFVEAPSARRGAALVLLACLGPLTHGRLFGLVLSALVLVLWATVRRRLTVSAAGTLIGVAAVAVALIEWFTSSLVDRMYTRALSTNTVRRALGNLADPGDVLIAAVGQVWYQAVATVGLSIIGAITVGRTLWRREGDETSAVLAVMFLPVAGVAAVFLSDTPQVRADYVVYGRYLDGIAGPLVVVGLGTLLFGRHRVRTGAVATVLVTTVVSAAIVDATRSAQLLEGRLVSHMVLGLLGFLDRPSEVDLWRASMISMGVLVVLAGVVAVTSTTPRAPMGRVIAMAGVLVVIAVLGRSANSVIQPRLNRLQAASAVEDAATDWLPDGVGVLYDLRDDRGDRRVAYQFYLPDHPVYALSNRETRPPTPFVFAPPDDAEIAAAGGVVLWVDPEVPIALHRVDAWAGP